MTPGAPACKRCRGRGVVIAERPVEEVWTPAMRTWWLTFRAWKTGHVLPDAGGLADQAATWVEAMTLVDQRLCEIEQEELEESRRRAAKP